MTETTDAISANSIAEERERLQCRMEAAWRQLTKIEQRTNPKSRSAVATAERAYDDYLAALAAYMAYAARACRDTDQRAESRPTMRDDGEE